MAPPARPRRLYLDTSAYLCILLAEEGHDTLSAETTGATLLSSVLLVLESRRNLARLARDGVLTPEQYQTCVARVDADHARFELRDLTLDLCAAPAMPALSTPRSLDLAHLQTARWFHGVAPLDRFVTLDADQEAAARELGLPVAPATDDAGD
jgi:PIN domain nuclease of toxin-antitoxin system